MGANGNECLQFIRSADRGRLNVQLLDALVLKDVKLFFHHRLRGLNLDANTAEFEKMFVSTLAAVVTWNWIADL